MACARNFSGVSDPTPISTSSLHLSTSIILPWYTCRKLVYRITLNPIDFSIFTHSIILSRFTESFIVKNTSSTSESISLLNNLRLQIRKTGRGVWFPSPLGYSLVSWMASSSATIASARSFASALMLS